MQRAAACLSLQPAMAGEEKKVAATRENKRERVASPRLKVSRLFVQTETRSDIDLFGVDYLSKMTKSHIDRSSIKPRFGA